jgi:transposase-like protein
VIVVAVRWYLRFNLSYRDVEELLVEHGIEAGAARLRVRRCGV